MKEKTNQNKFKVDYVSPALTEQILFYEGVLCGSRQGTMSIGDWEDDADQLNM